MFSSSHARPRFVAVMVRSFPASVAAAVLTLMVFMLAVAVADEPADDEVEDEGPAPAVVERAPVLNVYTYVFERGFNASLARGQLETLLQQKIAAVDAVCVLTDD